MLLKIYYCIKGVFLAIVDGIPLKTISSKRFSVK